MRRKAQAFTIGALLFASAILAVVIAGEGFSVEEDYPILSYYSQIKIEKVNSFNKIMFENSSLYYIESRMRNFEAFTETQANQKGITYDSFTLMALPDKNTALILNNAGETDLSYYNGSWTNFTMKDMESRELVYSGGEAKLAYEDQIINFTASTPRLVSYLSMSAQGENWENFQKH